MRKKLLILGGACACLFIACEIYSFVYDVEPNSHIFEEYLSDVTAREENPPSLSEWMDRQDTKFEIFKGWVGSKEFGNWLGDQCDACFNPYWEPSPHHNMND